MRKSFIIAISGVLSAVGIAFLFLSGVVDILTYVMPIVAGLIMIIICESINKKTAVIVFAVTSILSMLLVPTKECVITYIAFFGYYPIIREYFYKIKSSLVRTVLKLLLFNVTIIVSQLIVTYVFMVPFEQFLGKWGIVILLAMANCVFIMYDYIVKMLVKLYVTKYKNKVKKYIK